MSEQDQAPHVTAAAGIASASGGTGPQQPEPETAGKE